MAVLALLLLAQIVLGALQPWPLKIVVDYVLGHDANPMPEPFRSWVAAVCGDNLLAVLVLFVAAGVVLQIANQFASAFGTQVQVATGQRMVYDLRYRLFQHLQALGLHHHVTTSTGDAVYRVDVDSYSIENLVMSGLFPLATSVMTLVVMFVILAKLDLTVALLSLAVVPFLYLCLRYYANDARRSGRSGSRNSSRSCSSGSTRPSRRDPTRQELRARAVRIRALRRSGRQDHGRADRITWQQSMFGVVVGIITLLGTALVLIVGGVHVLRGEMTVGSLLVVIDLPRRRLRPAVGHRPHDRSAAGRARRRQARALGASPCCRKPSTRPAPSTPRRSRATSDSRASASPIRMAPPSCTTSPSRPSPAR